MRTCPHCGEARLTGDRFCGGCGVAVRQNDVATPVSRRPRLAVAAAVVSVAGAGLAWWMFPASDSAPAVTTSPTPAAQRFSQSRVFSSPDVSSALKALYQAADRYATDHSGVLPSLTTPSEIRDALARYLESPDLLMDPRVNQPLVANPAVGRQPLASVRAQRTVMFCGATEGTDGMRTAVDGAGEVRAVAPDLCTGSTR